MKFHGLTKWFDFVRCPSVSISFICYSSPISGPIVPNFMRWYLFQLRSWIRPSIFYWLFHRWPFHHWPFPHWPFNKPDSWFCTVWILQDWISYDVVYHHDGYDLPADLSLRLQLELFLNDECDGRLRYLLCSQHRSFPNQTILMCVRFF